MGVEITLFLDGVPIEPNSEATYRATENVLRTIDRMLQDLGAAVPDVLNDEVNALRHKVIGLAGDAGAVRRDLARWDGDHDKAMAERDFRRGKKR